MEFSEKIQSFLDKEFPNVDIDNMGPQQLATFIDLVTFKRQEYKCLEDSAKQLGNAAYGACANPSFYFYSIPLAGDITGECRFLTKFMWERGEKFFHEDIWERKDLWEKFDIDLDFSKKEWYQKQPVSVYSDTDSIDENSLLRIRFNDVEYEYKCNSLWNQIKNIYPISIKRTGHEVLDIDGAIHILNYKDGHSYYAPIKKFIRHKVSKSRWIIMSASGAYVRVTGDHSCIVIRDGEQIVVKPNEMNPATDFLVITNTEGDNKLSAIAEIKEEQPYEDEFVYDVEVDDENHTFIANGILVHNSVYTTYGTFFKCMKKSWHEKYNTDRKIAEWIVRFNKEFMDKQNNKWIDEIYTPRHGHSKHEFELELVNKIQLNLKKKKYLKACINEKGHWYEIPKIKGTGIELIKSTTPKLCREILNELLDSLLYESTIMPVDEYVLYFNEKVKECKKRFYAAPIEDISQSIGVNGYQKYVIDDTDQLIFAKKATPGVKACARYNYLAHKNGHDECRIYSGKIKYYNIRINDKVTDFFGFPSGEHPEWAPKIDFRIQWKKTIVEPINRFLEVMKLPLINEFGTIQFNLFGFGDDEFENSGSLEENEEEDINEEFDSFVEE